MDVLMPQLGETVNEGTITVWRKAPGDAVAADEVLFEVSTDKVDTEVPAPVSGILTEIIVAEGATVAVGTRLGVIETAGAAKAVAQSEAAKAAPARPPAAPAAARAAPVSLKAVPRRDARGRPLSPAVRRLVAEHRLDLAGLAGTGRDGRVTRRDVERLVGRKAPAARPAAGPETEVVPLSRIRKQIAEHMVRSKATSPHVLQAVEVDFHAVDAARAAAGEAFRAREGFVLTYLPFIARAVCQAIPDFPHVNASLDGDSMVIHHRVHLGIAVDLGPGGLMAPVIRDAGSKGIFELARAVRDLAERARGGRITPDELAGGTYTISNSGTFGTLITAPIIVQPQVAILSTDGVRKKPVVLEQPGGDVIAIRPVGVVAHSFDHRAIDGAYSAGFLRRLREILEGTDWTAALA